MHVSTFSRAPTFSHRRSFQQGRPPPPPSFPPPPSPHSSSSPSLTTSPMLSFFIQNTMKYMVCPSLCLLCVLLTFYSLLWPSRASRPGATMLVAPPLPPGAFLLDRAVSRTPSDSSTARGSVRLPRRRVLARRSRRRTRPTRARVPPPRTSGGNSAGTQRVVGAR